MRPDGAAKAEEEEYRLSVALLPLRLRIDQNMVAFLQGFFASPGPDRGNDESTSREDGTSNASTVQELEGSTAKQFHVYSCHQKYVYETDTGSAQSLVRTENAMSLAVRPDSVSRHACVLAGVTAAVEKACAASCKTLTEAPT